MLQAQWPALRQAASLLQARGLTPEEEAEPYVQPVAEVLLERPSARAVLSEPRQGAAEVEPLSVPQEAAEARPSAQQAEVAERDALRGVAAEQGAQPAEAEEPGVPLVVVAAAGQDVQPVVAVQDAQRVAEVAQAARLAAVPAQPSEARAVQLSAEPSARSDRPAPVLRLARR